MISIKAQYYVKVKGDTTHMETDSVLLSVDNSYGKVSWQVSTDSIKWMDLEEGNTFSVWIDSLAGYRATAVNENCPVISDTIEAGVIKTRVGYNFSMDDKGMVYELPSGLNIIVPPNAISGVNSLSIQEFDSIQAKSSLPFPADSGKAFLYAIKFNPANTNLLKPVKIRIPTSKYDRGDLPRIFLFNSETDEWINYTGDILCNRRYKYIELTLSNLQPFRMDACPGGLFITDEKKTQLRSMGKQYSKGNSNDPCYDLIRIKSEEIDFTTIYKNQECFFIDEEGSVEFLKCPNKPKDYWHIREIGKDCEPKVEVKIDDDPNKEFIKIGDDVVLTFFTYIYAGEEKNPLPDQFISFNLPEGLISDFNYVWTDNAGMKDLQVTATRENLNALINFTAHYNYCPELIEASSTNSFEGACQQSNITSDFDGIKRVIVYDDCTDPDALDCSQLKDANCETIKGLLIKYIKLVPNPITIDKGDNYKIEVKTFNFKDVDLTKTIETKWSSSNEDKVIVENGLITGIEKGTATITAEICDRPPLQCEVEVTNTICDSAKVKVFPLSVNIKEGCQYKVNIKYSASADYQTYIPVINFNSENIGIANVDEQGIIYGIKPGHTAIDINWCDENVKVVVEVTEVEFCDSVNIEINTNTINMNIGGEYRINTVNYETSSGNLYVPKVTFASSDNNIATVNSFGLLKAISEGETEVIVSWCNETKIIPVSVKNGLPYYHVIIHMSNEEESYLPSYSHGYFYNQSYQRTDNTIMSGEFIFQSGSLPSHRQYLKCSSLYRRTEIHISIKSGICPDESPYSYDYFKEFRASDSLEIDLVLFNSIGGFLWIIKCPGYYTQYIIQKGIDCAGEVWDYSNERNYEYVQSFFNEDYFPLSLTSNDGITYTGERYVIDKPIYIYHSWDPEAKSRFIYSATVTVINAYQVDK
jgi:hypothetical protein